MRNEEVVKNLVRCKLQIIGGLLNTLPNDLQEPVQKLQNQWIKIIHEATGEYLENRNMVKEDQGLKTIGID